MKNKLPFREKVHAVVARIPRGKVASYGLVALLAGRVGAARAVGGFMREAPRGLRLPCHRVIKADGALAPERIFGGRQKKLLLAEGVVVGPNGRVAMQKYEWDGAGGKRRRRGRA